MMEAREGRRDEETDICPANDTPFDDDDDANEFRYRHQ